MMPVASGCWKFRYQLPIVSGQLRGAVLTGLLQLFLAK
jgi:hypothetical protein